ncbi:hypothetical protein [Brevibacterium sp. VCM10]|uniref:hypothetical protein n=1 Tax=Brevibacterium sp. VCM10 TaxID=1381751 RepID=UPI0012DC2F27|nr:hypothetical protein [Brevibacterium sp. VCM10]
MTLVKGPNGLIVDVAPSVASGLIGGGHVVAVEDSDADAQDYSTDGEETAADQEEQTEQQVEDSDEESPETSTEAQTKPGGNASKQVWYDYALAQGFAEEQLDGLKQNEIRALFDE